jgi:hypothetical protein
MIEEGVYRHYKGHFYKVIMIVFDHETGKPMVVYHRCDIRGIFKSIREGEGENEVIVGQPFLRDLDDFIAIVTNSQGDKLPRFEKLLKPTDRCERTL